MAFIDDDEDYIYAYQILWEENFILNPRAIFRGHLIREHRRTELIDRFVLVAHKLESSQRTLYHMVSLIDRSLSLCEDLYNSLQLLGATCLFIASKFEESFPLNLSYMIDLLPHVFDRRDIFSMEKELLRLLQQNADVIDPINFIDRLVRTSGHSPDSDFREISFFLYDTLLPHRGYSSYRCSMLSASAVCGTLGLYGKSWNLGLRAKARYEFVELAGQAKMMLVNVYHIKCGENIPALAGTRYKYSCPVTHREILCRSGRLSKQNILRAMDMMNLGISSF